MALPPIPHSEIEPDCCGCLCEVIGDEMQCICNECGAVVSKEEVAPIVLPMESCEAKCPHCLRVSQIVGFSERFALFRCRYCGESVAISAP
jgi:hypothetical protein